MQGISEKKHLEDEIAFLSKKILELNKKLIESEKAKTLFLSLVANNFNDPMTAILGMLPHLKIQKDDKNEQIFSTIHKEALVLDFKIQNLIAVAEIESGNISNTRALIDIKTIIDEVTKSLQYLIKEKNLKIEINNSVQNKIVTDPKKIYIILENIIANACMYSPENESVIINISSDTSKLKINVINISDDIKVKYKPEVFTRFSHKIDSHHGLGIGLSIVRELCQNLGGSVDYSVLEGVVSFDIELPLDENMQNFEACGFDEFFFDSLDDAIEI